MTWKKDKIARFPHGFQIFFTVGAGGVAVAAAVGGVSVAAAGAAPLVGTARDPLGVPGVPAEVPGAGADPPATAAGAGGEPVEGGAGEVAVAFFLARLGAGPTVARVWFSWKRLNE